MPAWRRAFRRLRKRIAFALLKTLVALGSLGGFRGVQRLGDLAGRAHFHLRPFFRRDLERQLNRVFDRPPDDPWSRPILRHAYRVCDRAALEIAALFSRPWPDENLESLLEIDGLPRLDAALAQGNGVILMGAHMGNGILLAIRLARAGYPMTVVFRQGGKSSPAFFSGGFGLYAIEPIDVKAGSQATRAMLSALRANRIIYVLMDQGSKSGGVAVDFLGKQMEMPAGPARLALKTGAAVLPALALAAEPAWRFVIGEQIRLRPEVSVEDATRNLTGIMESHIRRHPELWTWHHRRWRRYPFIDPLSPSH